MAISQFLRRFVLLSALMNAILAVPLSPSDRSTSSSSVELIIKSVPDSNYTMLDNDAADSSRSIEQFEDDLSSSENNFDQQLLNTTDEETNNFAVRLARALQKMQFSHVPPTIVLNEKEVVEHTHVEEEPSLLPKKDVGHFAVAARPPTPSSFAQSQPRAPVNAVASPKMGNVVRRNFASALRSAAVAAPAGNSGGDCCDSNVYNGPVIVISNVKDLKVMNPPPPQDCDNQNEASDAVDEDDSNSAGDDEVVLENNPNSNDLTNII